MVPLRRRVAAILLGLALHGHAKAQTTVTGTGTFTGTFTFNTPASDPPAQVATPTMSPAAGSFTTAQFIKPASTTSGAGFSMSFDNSTPSATLTGPVTNATTPTNYASSCTYWMSPTGSGNGSSSSTPASLTTGLGALTAGAVGCVGTGTYSIASTTFFGHGGTSGSPIVLAEYNGPVTVEFTGTSGNMLECFSSSATDGYWIIQGINFDGEGTATNVLQDNGCPHWTFRYDTFTGGSAAGLEVVNTDYYTIDHNEAHKNGYGIGNSSGFDTGFNVAFDSYAGFHNFITNNVSDGNYDNTPHTDGNGFIMDDGSVGATNDPASLFANNVAYANGGRGFTCDSCSNVWFVNNTSYGNGLDTANCCKTNFEINSGAGVVWANNISYAWNSEPPFTIQGTISGNLCDSNQSFGGTNAVSGGCTGSSSFTTANPNFNSPTAVTSPSLTPTGSGQYANALSPPTGLLLNLNQTALTSGMNPTTLTTNANLISDMTPYLTLDPNGFVRSLSSMPVGALVYTGGSFQGTAPFALLTNLTVKAIGIKSGMTNSSQFSGAYSFTVP